MSTFQRIGIVDAIPAAGVKPGDGAAINALQVDMGNVLEITGTNSGGVAGTLILLRWFPPPPMPPAVGYAGRGLNVLGEWRRWREDAAIQVSTATDFSGRYEISHDSADYWLLLTDLEITDLTADAQGAYYRRSY